MSPIASLDGASGLGELDHMDELRHAADEVRQRVWAGLPAFLSQFADGVLAQGGHIHWATTASDACRRIHEVVEAQDASSIVVADRSRIVEEIGLRRAMRLAGTEILEPERRTIDIGITGAELAVARTGSVVLACNQGVGRLVHAVARTQVVVVSIDRLIAQWSQAELMLAAAAASDRLTVGPPVSIVTGPRGPAELDGPEFLHVVIVDNGRSGCSLARFRSSEPLYGQSDRSYVEESAWRLWATAWSDAERYTATTHATSWPRLVANLEGWLPASASWQSEADPADPDPQRFRDHWQRGWV